MNIDGNSNNTDPSTSTNSNNENKKTDTTEKNLALIISECSVKITTTENYLKRLQNLRKELTYINETEWMYEPLDKKPANQ